MSEKKFTAEMVGEAFRDAGILVFVFGPLYELFEPWKPRWSVFLALIIVGIVFFVLGIIVERRRA